MPLLEPAPVPPHTDLGHVHFIGIGGASMSGIAQLMARLGHRVSGSDAVDSPALTALAEQGIEVHVGHRAEAVAEADSVVITSALRADNPELVAARDRGLPVLHRSTALASLTTHQRSARVIAVSGTHGKTTTSAWIAVTLAALGRDPSYVVGAPIAASQVLPADSFARIGKGPEFVIEADESDGSFRQYPARIVVVTNVEADHLDNWGTAEDYAAGFDRFAAAEGVETAVVNIDDAGSRALAERIGDRVRVVTYGEHPDAQVRISQVELTDRRSSATVEFDGSGGRIRTALLGRHNLSNAAAAYAVGRLVGLSDLQVRMALERFAGTARRFQLVGEAHQIRVYDDYAHNPTKVRSALQAARTAAGRGRLVVCFQP
ncbi:MAG TPA: UDP-N-acetylmuramate--L-alanine ligase, partial [Candidatus Avipropionibacterium avicola]|nr:UDP-N-acetylmuramate--L-alanine ligase [Candidatus Avipropionibacterium avicola]